MSREEKSFMDELMGMMFTSPMTTFLNHSLDGMAITTGVASVKEFLESDNVKESSKRELEEKFSTGIVDVLKAIETEPSDQFSEEDRKWLAERVRNKNVSPLSAVSFDELTKDTLTDVINFLSDFASEGNPQFERALRADMENEIYALEGGTDKVDCYVTKPGGLARLCGIDNDEEIDVFHEELLNGNISFDDVMQLVLSNRNNRLGWMTSQEMRDEWINSFE